MMGGDFEQWPLFDPEGSRRAAEEAIARVEENANEQWKQAAFEAGERVARRRPDFTTDEIWRELAEEPARTHEPRAMGPVMRNLFVAGICRRTDRTAKTARVAAHRRDLRVWESLIYQER